MRAISRKESRDTDDRATRVLGIPSICLMENAGAGAARIAMEMTRSPVVVCICGPGGNGGDAMVVARHLVVAGWSVALAHVGPRPERDAGRQFEICAVMGLRSARVRGRDDAKALIDATTPPGLIVDGLYGIGLTRPAGGVAAAVIAAVNASGAPVLSLDVPSGLDADTGEPLGPCVRASVTATFAAPKLGFANPASRAWTGDVRVVPIGAPVGGTAPA